MSEPWAGLGGAGGWDILCTAYVLDCFPDPSAVIRQVSRLLVPGGRWINVGPLQWHAPDAGMLRLSWEQLRPLMAFHGLRVRKWRVVRRAPYLTHPKGRGMMLGAADQWHDVLFFEAVRQ
jgi:carnosine N-methyltransferase